jgi:hypothetical protein
MKTHSYPGEKGVLGAEFQVVESIHYIGLERDGYRSRACHWIREENVDGKSKVERFFFFALPVTWRFSFPINYRVAFTKPHPSLTYKQ